MYSVLATLFVIATFLIVAGFLGRVGTDGIADVSENVAAALGLLVTYAFLIISLGSFSELANFFEGMCGGIPFLNEIADYGSLRKVFTQNPLAGATAFMDTVFLSALIELITMLPLATGSFRGKFMVNLFVGILVAIISLLLLNYVIKPTSAYQWLVAAIGVIISTLSLGTIPAAIAALLSRKRMGGIGIMGMIALFSQSKIMGVVRSSFLKAIVYVIGIGLLEKHFGSIANGFSQISLFFVAFAPVVVMIIGLVFILKSVFS